MAIINALKKIFLVFAIVLSSFQCFSQNLLTNGDFENGGNGSGFTIGGAGYSEITAPFSGSTIPGNLAFTTNPFPMNTANFIASGDHTFGFGKMMVIDGNTTGGNQRFWKAGDTGGGVCGLTVGSTYIFSYWIRSVSNTVVGVPTQANIGIQILNASSVALVLGNTLAPLPAIGWKQVTYTFVPTSACVTIELWNTNTSAVGNDFAVDDFSVFLPQPLSVNYSTIGVSCPNANDGSISVYGVNGIAPYVSYSITGITSQTNTTGVFTNLTPGTYSVSVTDSNTPPATASLNNITVLPPPNLIVGATATSICNGSSINLSVSGSTNPYFWTASPIDVTLTSPNSPSPIVSPTQNTTYTATSTSSFNRQLIFNGDFSSGNIGFVTDHKYLTAGSGNYGSYGIASIARDWFISFQPCSANSGAGDMMVVDGSTNTSDRLWCQTVPVVPGQNYNFSYYIQSVFGGAPASIEIVINGISLGISPAPNSLCGWVQTAYLWNAGSSSIANICIYNRQSNGVGNDFAIDDISFTIPTNCNLSNSVSVSVSTSSLVPTVSVTQQPSCAGINSGTIVFTSPINVNPTPSDLFISEVTDETTDGLTYIEIYNGTGVTKNLANYRLKLYNNGSGIATCDLLLSGSLANNSVAVIAVGSVTNQGGVVPNLVFSSCTGVDTNDNIRLTTSGNVEIDLWGRTNGVAFTPSNAPGYTYRRLQTAPKPSLTWNLADWTALDPQVYTNVGVYTYLPTNYQYSLNGVTYQASPTFTNLAPGTYNVRVRDFISGCISTPIPLIINPIPITAAAPTVVSPVTYCQNATASPLMATPSVGGTLNWYGTNAVGGIASPTAPTPSTTTLGSTTYYVSQTIGCEGPRAAINVNIAVVGGTLNLICGTQTIPFVQTQFDWNNIPGSGISMMAYTYTIFGFPPVSGVINTALLGTNLIIPNPNNLPITMTITPANGTICVAPATHTCGCTSPQINTMTNQVFCGNSPISQINFTTADAYDTVSWTNSNTAIGLAASGSGLFIPAFTSANVATVQVATIGVTLIKNGCVGPTKFFTITINPLVNPIFNAVAPICSGQTLSPLPTTSTNGFSGSWSPALNNNTTTTYTFTPNIGQCATVTTMTIVVNPSPVLTITNPSAVCFPNTIDITLPAVTAGSTSGGALTYWTNVAATIPLANPTAIATSNTYYIKSTLTLGSCTDINPVVVTIATTPVLNITNPPAACFPNTVDITLPSVTAGSTGSGALTYWTNPTATIPLANPNAIATSNTYYIKSTLGLCIDINPVVVTIATTPVLNITNPTAVCFPNTVDITLPSVTAGSTGSGTLTYWTNAAATIPLANPTAIATSNTYYIKSTLGSCTDSSPVVVTIATTPVLNITNPPAVCFPNIVDITLPAVTAGSTGGGTLTYWTNASATIPLANPTTIAISNTYYIKSTLGSCTDINPVVVTIATTPVLNITNPPAVCFPNTVDITLPSVTAGSTGSGTLTYWTNAAATIPLINPSAIAISNTYYIKSTLGSCTDSSPVIVTINPSPVLNITNPAAVCFPNTVDITLPSVTAGSTGSGVLTYWTNPTATIPLANPTAIAISNTYYIKSTLGSCRDSSPVVVTIATTPVLNITNPPAVCFPNTVDITLPSVTAGSTGSGTLTYWTNAAATIPLINPSAIAISNTYYIKSTLGSCTDSSPVLVTINPSPVLNITNPSSVCSPNTIDISLPAVTAGSTVGGTLTYWTNAAATIPLANPTAIAISNTYYIKSTLGSCTDSSPVVVTIATTPVLNIIDPAPVCFPNTVDITLPSVTAGSTGSGTLTYWTNAAATIPLINPSAIAISNTYYIKSTLGSCTDSSPVLVTINPSPVLNITNPSSVCSPNTIDITLPAVTAGSTVGGTLTYWTNAAATIPLATPSAVAISGTYYIKSTLGLCTDVNPVIVTIVTTPVLTIIDPAVVCIPNTVDITLPAVTAGSTGAGILTYWTDALATMPLSNPTAIATSNTYYIKSTVSSCTDIEPVVVTIATNINANTPPPLQLCDFNNDGYEIFNLTLAINSITGGAPYIVTFHETITDANIDGTAISNPSAYANINPGTQIIFVRVESNIITCFEVVQLQLQVDPTPEATTPDDYELCDYTGAVGFESFDLTTTIPQILGNINPALTTVTFHPTQVDASADTNAISNVTNYINQTIATQTLYVRVETIATGCYDTVALNLIVNPLPNSLQPNYPQYTLCDTTGAIGFETFDLASQATPILLGQTGMSVTFYPSLTDAQNGTNAITNLQYTNTTIYVQTLGVKITNATTGCYVISTIDIRVEPLPTPIPPTQPYTICDDNQDGFAGFDLTTLIPDLLQGAVYTISFYETLSDAQLGTNPIDTTQLYNNINPFVQTLYVRAQDPITGCWSLLPIVLNVNPSPVAPVLLDNIIECDDDNNPQNAITAVDLTQRTADALALQPASGSYTVTYYTSQTAAQNGTAPIVNDTNYVGTDGQTIWVRVEDTTTGCYNIGSFELEINTPLLLITPTPLNVCDDDANPNDQYHSFDLTVKNSEIISSGVGSTVTYYPSLTDAQNNTNVITTPTAYTNITPAVQTLGVVVTTPAPANCQSITTLDIRVLPIPTPNTDPRPLPAACDNNNPGDLLEIFDLTLNAAYIANGDPNVTLHYFPTQADAQNNVVANEILTPTAALVGTTVWIRVENNRVDYQGNRCFVIVAQPLSVNPLPIVIQPLAPYRVCDNDADGLAIFDLTNPQLAITILGATQLPADYTISYYATAQGANPITNTGQTPLPSSYQNTTPNTQDIYIRVVNNTTGCVNTGILPLAVEEYALATGPQFFESCDSYTDAYDGVFQLDLTQFNAVILNGQNPAIFLISYYHTQADAMAGINAIPLAEAQAYVTTPDTDQIWVKVENSSNSITPLCYALTTIEISIERAPNPIINTANDVNTICVDFTDDTVVRPLTLDSGVANPANYTFEWFEDASTTPIAGATGPTYTVDTASPTGATRNYTVRVTSNSPLACATTSAVFPVIQSGQAVIPQGTVGYTVTNAFSEIQIITVTVEGYGTYEYSLDDGPRQTSNIFENVSLGTHVIHIWDSEGGVAFSCEELIIQGVQIIDYPHYFTPNGDGIHDTWNIVGLGGQPAAKIYIFDRYGKLLKQISSTGQGWDGTYNGYLLPSTDYWFSVEYEEQTVAKVFKAHFSLKR